MKKLLIFSVLLISFRATAQIDSLVVKIQKTDFDYKAALFHENRIYAITTSGEAVIWDLHTLDTVSFTHNDTGSYKILCIANDRSGRLYFGTSTGYVFEYKPETGEWSVYKKINHSVHHIFFNSANEPIFIIANAVYDPVRKRYWTKFENRGGGLIVKKKVMGLFSKRIYQYFNMPDYTFLDSRDRLWMTASFGEFGGSVQVFDTKNYRIEDNHLDSLSMGLLFPKSVFEGPDGKLFMTSGLQHFRSSGQIYEVKADRSVRSIFESSGPRILERKTKKVLNEGGLFIGPGAYNKGDSCIYFATNRGIHRISLDEQNQQPVCVINPGLSWEREPAAIGMAMNIKRMEFLSNDRLLFLTVKDGIGILQNGLVTLLK